MSAAHDHMTNWMNANGDPNDPDKATDDICPECGSHVANCLCGYVSTRDAMTTEEFDAALLKVLATMTPAAILSIPGVVLRVEAHAVALAFGTHAIEDHTTRCGLHRSLPQQKISKISLFIP